MALECKGAHVETGCQPGKVARAERIFGVQAVFRLFLHLQFVSEQRAVCEEELTALHLSHNKLPIIFLGKGKGYKYYKKSS